MLKIQLAATMPVPASMAPPRLMNDQIPRPILLKNAFMTRLLDLSLEVVGLTYYRDRDGLLVWTTEKVVDVSVSTENYVSVEPE